MQKSIVKKIKVLMFVLIMFCTISVGSSESKQGWPAYEYLKHIVVRVCKGQGFGSGVIIHSSGDYGTYILTAAHVVDGDKIKLKPNNEKVDTLILVNIGGPMSMYSEVYMVADILKVDISLDLALIKIRSCQYGPNTHVKFPTSIAVGEDVYHIGNPLGYDLTLTKGIVSYIDRWIQFGGIGTFMIQTDAALAGGSSGGGIFSVNSELLGIVSNTAAAIPQLNMYDGKFSFFVPYYTIQGFLLGTSFPSYENFTRGDVK